MERNFTKRMQMRERRKGEKKKGEEERKKLRMDGVAFFRNAQPNAHRSLCLQGLD